MPKQQRSRVCPLCRQPLPEGSSFCVGCGIDVDPSAAGRRLEIDQQLRRREAKASFWRNIFRFLRIVR